MSVNHASFWSPLTKSFERTMTLLLLASRRRWDSWWFKSVFMVSRSRSLFNWLDLVLGFAARGGSEKVLPSLLVSGDSLSYLVLVCRVIMGLGLVSLFGVVKDQFFVTVIKWTLKVFTTSEASLKLRYAGRVGVWPGSRLTRVWFVVLKAVIYCPRRLLLPLITLDLLYFVSWW